MHGCNIPNLIFEELLPSLGPTVAREHAINVAAKLNKCRWVSTHYKTWSDRTPSEEQPVPDWRREADDAVRDKMSGCHGSWACEKCGKVHVLATAEPEPAWVCLRCGADNKVEATNDG